MKITKVKIKNFKSIENLELEISKCGNSYTKMFVGINESGKSNILEALSFFETPEWEFNFNSYCNQKNQNVEYVDLFFDLEFEYKNTYLNQLKKNIDEQSRNLLAFEIKNIKKNVYLKKNESQFQEEYNYNITFPKKIFIRNNNELSLEEDEEKTFQELTREKCKEIFDIDNLIKKYEPIVSFWKPSDDYFLKNVNLHDFKNNTNQNKPLKNIFALNEIDSDEKILSKISDIENNTNLRRGLQKQLSTKATEYINNIWKHPIKIDVEIDKSLNCDIHIVDKGKENEDYFYAMKSRSEGAKHFLSLMFSLSIENRLQKLQNRLILIDEPEAHLHPSGIRDLGKELLGLGKKNFVFVATHSPFLIDRKNKERNIIIKKNNQAITQKKEIKEYENCIDDEVLKEAFGIEVYKDLLNPHSILVEGKSDKIILQKALKIKGKNYGITNGHGSNIDTLASKLNDSGIEVLVLLDDDKDGKNYKKKIQKIGNFYSNNVFTIRDLLGDIKANGTIEDTLNKEFIGSKFKDLFNLEKSFDEKTPFVQQAINFLESSDKTKNNKQSLEKFKIKISEDFNATKTNLQSKHSILDRLVDKIIEKIESRK